MSRLGAALALVIGVAALASCSGATSPATATASPTQTVDKQTRFLTTVHSAGIASWAVNGPTDAELELYPDRWCTALGEDHSVAYILSGGDDNLYPIGSSWGTKKPDAERVLVLAVTAYCPSLRPAVVQQLQASGDW